MQEAYVRTPLLVHPGTGRKGRLGRDVVSFDHDTVAFVEVVPVGG